MRRALPVIAIALAALAGCASVPRPAPTPQPTSQLAGTRWELVEFRSMDDAIGVVRPARPGSYAVEFGADGRAALRLDCNQGSAAYAQDGANGLRFGPVASTMKLCPGADGMAERLGRDLPNIVSHVRTPQGLALALKMDGGIYSFRPLPPKP